MIRIYRILIVLGTLAMFLLSAGAPGGYGGWVNVYRFGVVHPTARILDMHLSVFLKPECIRIGAHSRIDALVKIEGGQGVHIGEYVHIASFVHINAGGGTVVFGDHSGCASGARIVGGYPDPAYLHVSAAEPPEHCHVVRKVTRIGAYAVVFSNAVVYPGVTIGDGSLIGAGSVVTKDVPAWEVWGGCPARKLRDRPFSDLRDIDEQSALVMGELVCH